MAEFKCAVLTSYEIPDDELQAVIDQHRANWAPEKVELFPNDLINVARKMGIGNFTHDDDEAEWEVESDEAALTESDVAEITKPKKRRRS